MMGSLLLTVIIVFIAFWIGDQLNNYCNYVNNNKYIRKTLNFLDLLYMLSQA